MEIDVYAEIYKKLDKLGIFNVEEYEKRTSDEHMDLNICRLGKSRWALSQLHRTNGDPVPDPDMEIRVYHTLKLAEALSYQDTYLHNVTYPELGKPNIQIKKVLNRFLNEWLEDLLEEGFGKTNKGKKSNCKKGGKI